MQKKSQEAGSSARKNDPDKVSLPKIDQQRSKTNHKVRPTYQMKISKPYAKQAIKVPLYIREEPVKEPPSLFKKEKAEPKVFQFDAGFFKGPKAKKVKQEKIIITEEEEEKEYRMRSRFKLYPRKPLQDLKEVDEEKSKQRERRHRHGVNGEELEHEYYENEEEEENELEKSRKLMLKEQEEEEKRRERRRIKKEEEEARRKAEEEEARRKAEEEEARRKAEEEEARRKAEEEARRKAEEEEARRKAEEEEARRKAEEEEARRKAEEEEARRKAEEEARRKAEEEARRKAEEEEARRKAEEEEARRKAEEEEARRKAEEEARRKAEEEEARRKAEEEEARRKAEEEEARRKAEEEEARRKAEEEARRKAEEEEARRKAEEEARRKAEEEARRKAEEEARRKAEEEARRKAEEEARRKAEEEARRKAEEEARRKAEEEAKRKAEEEAKKKAEEEAKRKAEEEAKKKAEEEARRKAEEEARRKADEEAKKKAEEEAKRKAEEEAKRKAEEEAKKKAEEEAKRKAEEEARRKAEEEAKSQKSRKIKNPSTGEYEYDAEDEGESKLNIKSRDITHKLVNGNQNESQIQSNSNNTEADSIKKSDNQNEDDDDESKSSTSPRSSSKKGSHRSKHSKKGKSSAEDDDEDLDDEEEDNKEAADQQPQQQPLSPELLQELPPPLPKSNYVLGIDFGTTTTRFGIYKDSKLDDRIAEYMMSSAVAFNKYTGEHFFNFIHKDRKSKNNNKDGKDQSLSSTGKKGTKGGFSATGHLHICLNDDEDDIMSNDDYIVVPAIKRLLGREISEDMAKSLPFDLEISSGKGKREKIKIADTDSLSFEQVAALILAEAKRIVDDQVKEDVVDAVICVPSFFSNNQKTSMKDAATIAGFNVVKLISETTAIVTALKANNGKHFNEITSSDANSSANSDKNKSGALEGIFSNTLTGVLSAVGSNKNGQGSASSNSGAARAGQNASSNSGAASSSNSNGGAGNGSNANNGNNASAGAANGSSDNNGSAGNQQPKVIVIEFGGGTLDTSIVGFDGEAATIYGTSGDTSLGGIDIDKAIANYVLAKVPKDKAKSIVNSRPAMRVLERACEVYRTRRGNNQGQNGKTGQSSSNPSDSIVVEDIIDGYNLNVKLSDKDIGNIISPFCQRLTACLDDLLKHSNSNPTEIKDLVFCGGVMKTPMMQEAVTNFLIDSIKNQINPNKTADTSTNANANADGGDISFGVIEVDPKGVMLGAALQGAISKGDKSIKPVKIKNTSVLSIGFSLADGTTNVLIPRGTAIPCSFSTMTTTFKDNQRNVTFDIIEGERKMAQDNIKLGNVCVHGIEKAPRGVPKIEIKMGINEEGILVVKARDKATGATIKTRMTSKTNLSKDQVKKMLAVAELNKQKDKYRREQAEAQSKLKFYIIEMENKGRDIKDKEFLDLIDKYYYWLDENDDVKPSEYTEMYKKAKYELGTYFKKIQSL